MSVTRDQLKNLVDDLFDTQEEVANAQKALDDAKSKHDAKQTAFQAAFAELNGPASAAV